MNNGQANIFDRFLLTITFFTRVPLPSFLTHRISEDQKLADAAYLFPVAGLAIATIPALIWLALVQLFPATIAAGFAIVAGVVITGALHEDGLADCADGLGATSKRERVLEIMRDSRIGTYGAIALIFSIALRWLALATLPPMYGVFALFLAHSGSRFAITIPMRFSTYARKDGLGSMAENMPENAFAIASATAIVVSVLLGGIGGVLSVVAGCAVSWLFLKYLERRIGGYTGDGLGAIQQICEITILIMLTGMWL